MLQKLRILFYAHDGTGLGHLRRISRIAKAFERDASCMIMCGHREAAWIVSPGCEYIHIPNFPVIQKEPAGISTPTFVSPSLPVVREFRRKLLHAAVDIFAPDAIVVDHNPAGKHSELLQIVRTTKAKLFLIIRGVMDNPNHADADIIDTPSRALLEMFYTAIFVACDSRICDVAKEYNFSKGLEKKTQHVGYVSEAIAEELIKQARYERGLRGGKKWVVCSAGSGALGEALVEECIRLSERFTTVAFDIVAGPRCTLSLRNSRYKANIGRGRVRIHSEVRDLATLHASADVVVCAGGYNSTVEVLEGYAQFICAPTQVREKDSEQFIHATRLARFLPLHLMKSIPEIAECLPQVLASKPIRRLVRGRDILSFDGAYRLREIIFRQLNAPTVHPIFPLPVYRRN